MESSAPKQQQPTTIPAGAHLPPREVNWALLGGRVRFVSVWGIAGITALLLAYFGLAIGMIRGDRLKPELESYISQVLGRRATVGKLRFAPLTGELVAEDLVIADDAKFGTQPFLRAKSAWMGIRIVPLFLFHKSQITGIVLDDPAITLRQDSNGSWNFSSLFDRARAAGGATAPAIRLKKGRLSVEALPDVASGPEQKPLRFHDVELSLGRFSLEGSAPLTLTALVTGGGALRFNGNVGPVKWDTGIAAIRWSGLIKLERLDLVASDVMSAASGVSGVVYLDASGESDGRTLRLLGQVRARTFKLSQHGVAPVDPMRGVFTLVHDFRAHTGTLERGDVQFAEADASITGKYATGARPLQLDMAVSLHGAPVASLAALLPAVGMQLPKGTAMAEGVASAELTLQGPVDAPVTSGSLTILNARLTGFEPAKRFAAVNENTLRRMDDDLEIEWKSTLKVSGGKAELKDISTDVKGLGQLTGSGAIRPDGSLDFDMAFIENTPPYIKVTGDRSNPIFLPASRPR